MSGVGNYCCTDSARGRSAQQHGLGGVTGVGAMAMGGQGGGGGGGPGPESIYGEPESPNEGACVTSMMEPESPNDGGMCKMYEIQEFGNRQMVGRV